MKKILCAVLLAGAVSSLSGCVLLDEDFWEDDYSYGSGYDDECDCEEDNGY